MQSLRIEACSIRGFFGPRHSPRRSQTNERFSLQNHSLTNVSTASSASLRLHGSLAKPEMRMLMSVMRRRGWNCDCRRKWSVLDDMLTDHEAGREEMSERKWRYEQSHSMHAKGS